MRTEHRPVYIADDGTEFDGESECMRYESAEHIVSYLSGAIYLRDASASEVVRALMDRYDIVERNHT